MHMLEKNIVYTGLYAIYDFRHSSGAWNLPPMGKERQLHIIFLPRYIIYDRNQGDVYMLLVNGCGFP